MVDFMKWDEVITVRCVNGVNPSDPALGRQNTDLASWYSALRNWIYEKQGNVFNRLFLQLLVVDATSTSNPQTKFDPISYPAGVFTGFGYQGMATEFSLQDWEAASNQIEFSITWQCGIVVPI
jgi:hypothetical protein